jgi:phospholipid-binding lipoprotein MlaA
MHQLTRLVSLLLVVSLAGCASSGAHNNPKDPFESFNRGVYKINDAVDQSIVKPVAKGYNAVVPSTAKIMVSNFFSNLDDVIVTANDLLQLKFVQAVSDGGRVLINTTIGVFGLIDVAKATGYEKHNEDFGQTLGYWGVPSGPYLFLPLLGPSSIRDGSGLYVDGYTSVISNTQHVPTRNSAYAVKGVEIRAGLLDQEGVMEGSIIDRYSFIRDAYLAHRQNLVYDGDPPREKYDDEEAGDQ